MQVLTVFLFVILCYQYVTTNSFIYSAGGDLQQPKTPNKSKQDKPDVYQFHVYSDIQFRFARTVVSSRVANPANVAQEVSFSAVLPNTAFISGFLMEVDGKVYNAYVKEKEAAKYEYNEAVRQGRTAAHVALSARDSNRFTVSVNVEPQEKVTFNLTYEELLNRKLGTYEHVINLDPGQIVKDFSVEVQINESSDITTLEVPALRISNEISENPESEQKNPLAIIDHPTPLTAIVKYAPTPKQQRELDGHGIKGQLIVKYDVNRTSNSGEVLVNDGYFVHFFAPADLSPLPKLVTFVLDVSGSMSGRKIDQLRQAMLSILDDLNYLDFFSIILFSTHVQVWDYTMGDPATEQSYQIPERMWPKYSESTAPATLAKAIPENINKAKKFVQNLYTKDMTNIHGALMKALEMSRLRDDVFSKLPFEENYDMELEEWKHKHEPIIIFLTDGQPNVGVSNTDKIVSIVSDFNTGNFSIFSLAMGNDADMKFLQKLSLRNSGFARKIYEASDTALQLRDFYRQVASPLLANVTFKYLRQQVDEESVTKRSFRRLFDGAELVVAGKLLEESMTGEVQGRSSSGPTKYFVTPLHLTIPSPRLNKTNSSANKTVSSLERMWAYLTIKQLLEEEDKEHNRDDHIQTSPGKKRALQLALQYSFVTPLTSLVVVKPNETQSVDTEDASDSGRHSNRGQSGRPHNRKHSGGISGRIIKPLMFFQPSPARLSGTLDGFARSSIIMAPSSRMDMGSHCHKCRIGHSSSKRGRFRGVHIHEQQPKKTFSAPVIQVPQPPVAIPPSWLTKRTTTPPLTDAYVTVTIPTSEAPVTDANLTTLIPTSKEPLTGSDAYVTVTIPTSEATVTDAYVTVTIPTSEAPVTDANLTTSIPTSKEPLTDAYVTVTIPTSEAPVTDANLTTSVPTSKEPLTVQTAHVLANLSDVRWLKANQKFIFLPTGFKGSTEILPLAGANETNIVYTPCRTPTFETGHCMHLRYCVLQTFIRHKTEFLPYFCRINSFAGVCCPDYLQSNRR